MRTQAKRKQVHRERTKLMKKKKKVSLRMNELNEKKETRINATVFLQRCAMCDTFEYFCPFYIISCFPSFSLHFLFLLFLFSSFFFFLFLTWKHSTVGAGAAHAAGYVQAACRGTHPGQARQSTGSAPPSNGRGSRRANCCAPPARHPQRVQWRNVALAPQVVTSKGADRDRIRQASPGACHK